MVSQLFVQVLHGGPDVLGNDISYTRLGHKLDVHSPVFIQIVFAAFNFGVAP